MKRTRSILNIISIAFLSVLYVSLIVLAFMEDSVLWLNYPLFSIVVLIGLLEAVNN